MSTHPFSELHRREVLRLAGSAVAFLVRAFNAISYAKLPELAHRQGDPVGMPIAGDDQNALAIASRLTKEVGFEPVVVGGLAMGKYLNVGTPLAGIHTPDEIKQIAATLK